ncbi:MAG: urea ABC transporter permease subunit UrtC [Candidatus Rokuibacteriota bacterium]|nr:MAG: urea ABC transporter permease subunit UrtC [Candidatus Rokubacteria bacterium]
MSPDGRGSAWTTDRLAVGVFAIVFVVALPIANIAGLVSDYYLNLFGKYLALAILALGMDLLWGYAGILSLGQAIFFGIGAYAIGMFMMLEGSGKGVYGEPVPDFMIWNQVYQLPWFWKPFRYLPVAVAGAVLLPALLAVLIGLLTFRRKLRGTYFAILTQAIAFAVWLTINRNEMKLGGTNGLTDFKSVLGFSLSGPATQRALYVVTAAVLMIAFALSRRLVRSKTGLVLQAIRDNERRLEFLGYNTASFKIFVFGVAGGLAGLAGLLYAPQVGIITPSQVGVLPSLEIVIWVAFGGRGTLWGALLGAVSINWLRSVLTGSYPRIWPIILGVLFVAVIMLFPRGLVGFGARLGGLAARRPLVEPPMPAAVDVKQRVLEP